MSKFVQSPVQIFEGAAADERLAQVNDSRFAAEDGSVSEVDTARWEQAQEYERATWLEFNRGSLDDRNGDHRDGFGGYVDVPADLGAFIEIGCGPFTNSRIILEGRTAKSVTLLDPLADEYRVDHPNCHYRDGGLSGHAVEVIAKPIETWATKRKFDTLVCINVLSHCQSATAVFNAIRVLLKKGGLLVFHDLPRDIDPMQHYDVGHPIALKAAAIDAFLAGFEPLYHTANYYFIGRKR